MVSTINNTNSIERTVFTPLKGSTYSTWGECYYAKTGNIVQVHLAISGLTANTTNTIFTLPVGFRPSGNIAVFGGAGSTSQTCMVQIDTNGVITAFPNGNTYCAANATFIAMN